ncbi:MAG: VCBS repeat-containing protein, partial [Planctomycetota bacterium]|nr:VCBS repeat-containing protein [Planctomycetota bacterium]
MSSAGSRSHLAALVVATSLSALPGAARGVGVFRGAELFPLKGTVVSLELADFDADGGVDAVVLHGDRISLLLAGGEDVFRTPLLVDVEPGSRFLASGDFNGDDLADVVVGGPSSLTVYLSLGELGFERAGSVPASLLQAVEVADLDGDGALDALAVDLSGNGRVHVGNGDGGLAPGQDLPELPFLRQLIVDDLDGDGAADLVVTRDPGLSVYPGRGDGTFALPVDLPFSPLFVVAGDFLGDALPDLAIIAVDGEVSLLHNRGTRGFDPRRLGVLDGFPAVPRDLRPPEGVDFDGDGVLDLVTPFDGARRDGFRVFLGPLEGEGVEQLEVELGLDRLGPLSFVDADRDGLVDGVGARSLEEELLLFRGNPQGRVDAPASLTLGKALGDLVTLDANRDGRPDLLALSRNALHLARSRPEGGFAVVVEMRFATSTFRRVARGDFDGDGWDDVAVSQDGGRSVFLIFFDPGGGLARVALHRFRDPVDGMVAADLDGDGRCDLAFTSRDLPEVTVLLRLGIVGAKPEERVLFVGEGQQAIASSDVDGDGNEDLVTSTAAGIRLHFGAGDGTFPRIRSVRALASATLLALDDVDRDGAMDLLGVTGRRLTLLSDVASPGE